MKRPGGTTLVVLAAALAVLGATATAAPAASTSRADTASALLAAVNDARAQHGLRRLHRTHTLGKSAQLKATEIRACGRFSHTPCGIPLTRTFQQSGYFRGQVHVGENLYWGTGSLGSASSAVNAWLHSPPHRANLLGHWRDAGIGVVHASPLFGRPDVWLLVFQFGRHT
jgi:uncharacterized protein YkwD